MKNTERDGSIRKKLKTTSNTHITTLATDGTLMFPAQRSMELDSILIIAIGVPKIKMKK